MINDYSQIKQVVSGLVHDFTLSSSANSRKGGLVGLAATAIALGRVSDGGSKLCPAGFNEILLVHMREYIYMYIPLLVNSLFHSSVLC